MRKLVGVLCVFIMLTGCSVSEKNTEQLSTTEQVEISATTEDLSSEDNTGITEKDLEENSEETTQTVTTASQNEEQQNVEGTITEEQTAEEQITDSNEDADNADFYSICSTYSKEEIEGFAMTIKTLIMEKDWEQLSDKVSYPITIGSVECNNSEDFSGGVFADELNDDFYSALEAESCEEMFCNYAGIMMANGHVWFAETIDLETEARELKVISITP